MRLGQSLIKRLSREVCSVLLMSQVVGDLTEYSGENRKEGSLNIIQLKTLGIGQREICLFSAMMLLWGYRGSSFVIVAFFN